MVDEEDVYYKSEGDKDSGTTTFLPHTDMLLPVGQVSARNV